MTTWTTEDLQNVLKQKAQDEGEPIPFGGWVKDEQVEDTQKKEQNELYNNRL
mgnify:FL=1